MSLLRPLPARCEQCNPNWWIHFALQTLEPSIDLTGSYTVTFIADSTCSGLPQEARTRTYVATATPLPLDSSHFNVGVTGATFPIKEIAPNAYVTFGGEFKTVVADTAAIAGAFDGEVKHCSLATSWGGRRSCNSGEGIRHAQCLSPKHQLILERR